MAQSIQDVMTPSPETVPDSATIVEAAQVMRANDVGDVVVMRDGEVCGIVTDRDIVVRAVAEAKDPERMTVGDICSSDLVSLAPDETVDQAVQIMRAKALRRLPIIDGNQLVGIVSLGDLAIERDPGSVLAGISAAPPNT